MKNYSDYDKICQRDVNKYQVFAEFYPSNSESNILYISFSE